MIFYWIMDRSLLFCRVTLSSSVTMLPTVTGLWNQGARGQSGVFTVREEAGRLYRDGPVRQKEADISLYCIHLPGSTTFLLRANYLYKHSSLIYIFYIPSK